MAHSATGILTGKLPVYNGPRGVALRRQGHSLPPERRGVRDAAGQALPAEHPDFNLRHIEPATMLGRIVELQSAQHPPGLGRREGLVQGGRSVSVEVVQNHPNHLGLWVSLVHQPPHLLFP